MAALQELDEGDSLASYEDEVDVAVVDFGATWCSPCHRQRPIFERVADWFDAEHPEASVVFVTVDVDENEHLPAQFKVKSVPTTIVTRYEDALLWGKRWREKKRFQGVVPFETLRGAVADVLAEE